MVDITLTEKQMNIVLTAQDKTGKAFKSMRTNAEKTSKTVGKAFRSMKKALLAFTATIAIAVLALKKMITAKVAITTPNIDEYTFSPRRTFFSPVPGIRNQARLVNLRA